MLFEAGQTASFFTSARRPFTPRSFSMAERVFSIRPRMRSITAWLLLLRSKDSLAPPGTMDTHPGSASISPKVIVTRWESGARFTRFSMRTMKSAAAMPASLR